MKTFGFMFMLFVTNNWVNRIPMHWLRILWYRRVMRFDIGRHSYIHMRVTFDTWKNFHIGDHSVINARCRVDNRAMVSIGGSVSISQDVIILTGDHDLRAPNFDTRLRSVTIGNHVFIGTRAIILPGLRLATGSAVGASALVTSDVARHTVVAGVPARPIGANRPTDLDYSAGYGPLFQ